MLIKMASDVFSKINLNTSQFIWNKTKYKNTTKGITRVKAWFLFLDSRYSDHMIGAYVITDKNNNLSIDYEFSYKQENWPSI